MYAASQAAPPDIGGAGDEEGGGITPAEYLRMRRAGQTAAQAAQAEVLPSQERLTPATLLLRLGVLRRGAYYGSVQLTRALRLTPTPTLTPNRTSSLPLTLRPTSTLPLTHLNLNLNPNPSPNPSPNAHQVGPAGGAVLHVALARVTPSLARAGRQ